MYSICLLDIWRQKSRNRAAEKYTTWTKAKGRRLWGTRWDVMMRVHVIMWGFQGSKSMIGDTSIVQGPQKRYKITATEQGSTWRHIWDKKLARKTELSRHFISDDTQWHSDVQFVKFTLTAVQSLCHYFVSHTQSGRSLRPDLIYL